MMRAEGRPGPRTLPDALPLPESTPPPAPSVTPPQDDGVRWLALLIRQGLLLINAGIEARYGLKRTQRGDLSQ